jgi:alpha-amylase/alpha-mannosidase (GH57 family)
MATDVALLWHMHQPCYVDNTHGTVLMPWVRLHATKGYLDMIRLVEQYPELRCTFNLTPVLLRQLEQLAACEVRDLWHELATTPAGSLTEDQQCSLLEHYFKANWDNMIKPYPRYWSLLQKRGTRLEIADLTRIAVNFSEQEYRDIQAWLHLAWFGHAAQKLYPEIGELKKKGRDFTEQDKHVIFACQQKILRDIIARYKAAADKGQIEITTTPFYHPILPLLCNSEFARRCKPDCKLPSSTFRHPEDARAQLQLARDYHAKLFGQPPRGLWPSEGSVCPEIIPILRDLGFEWFATDEEVLWRSLANEQPQTKYERQHLYQGFAVERDGARVNAAFRDHGLSDFIGFTASRNPPNDAADLLVAQIEQNARHGRLCPIILDGENAWEYFPDGGEAFLRRFYERLTMHRDIKTTTFHQHFKNNPPRQTLRSLYSGSWIDADFHIWIGDEEDNRAWQLLGETRDFLEQNSASLSHDVRRKAFDEIYAAEGSDWFWWYGDQFVTEDDLLFDELFRTHLRNVYQLLDAPVPAELRVPICRPETPIEATLPTGPISPVVDGKVTSFYEWNGAGRYEAGRAMSAMHRSDLAIQAIQYGFDETHFYIRVDFRRPIKLPHNPSLQLNFIEPRPQQIVFAPLRPRACKATSGDAAWVDILEWQIPIELIADACGDEVDFYFQLFSGDAEWERHPSTGVFALETPGEIYPFQSW